MPKLGSFTVERVELPSTDSSDDKAWVEIKSKLTLGDFADLFKVEDEIDQTILALSRIIVDWNYTEDGSENTPKLPIDEANIRKLETVDFIALSEKVKAMRLAAREGITDAEKKDSPSGSQLEETPMNTSPQQITVSTET